MTCNPNVKPVGDMSFPQYEQQSWVAPDPVNHPPHYGGDTTYEVIKVIEAWGLGFSLGSAVKYIARAGKKGDAAEDLRKARWLIDREIQRMEAARADHAHQ